MKRILLTAMLLGCYDATPVGWVTDDSDTQSIVEHYSTVGHPSSAPVVPCDALAHMMPPGWHVERCQAIAGGLPQACVLAAIDAIEGGDIAQYVGLCGGDVLYLRQ
jgi:hypothetical protein